MARELTKLDYPNPADRDLAQGYLDGLGNGPSPGNNRSRVYKHGFINGQVDSRKIPRRGMSSWQIQAEFDTEMMLDILDGFFAIEITD